MKTSEIISLCALLFTISYAVFSEIIKFFSNRKRKNQQKQIDDLDKRLTVAQEKMNTKFDELKEGNEKNSRMIIKALILINGKKYQLMTKNFLNLLLAANNHNVIMIKTQKQRTNEILSFKRWNKQERNKKYL